MADNGHSSWSDLLSELLQPIFQMLETRSDILSFRSVCKNWRSNSVPPSRNILFPILPHQIPTLNNLFLSAISNGGQPLSITASSVILLIPLTANQPSWMVMAEEVEQGKLQLRHPITGKLFNLPVTHLDATRFDVCTISQHFNVRNSNLRIMKVVLHDEVALILPEDGTVGSLTLVPSPNAYHANNANLTSVWSRGVACPNDWLIMLPKWDDIVSYNGMNIGLETDGRLCVFDYESGFGYPPLVFRGMLEINNSDVQSTCGRGVRRRKRLVIHPMSGKLHLVVRLSTRCCVYVLNEEYMRWDEVESLGNNIVLIVGVDHSFFAWTLVSPGNCVVFADNSFPVAQRIIYQEAQYWYGGNRPPSLALDFVDERRIWVYHLGDHNFSLISQYPEFCQMLCLPPSSWFSN